MRTEFTNRLDSFRTTLAFLDSRSAVWKGQPPLRFTKRAADAVAAVDELAAFCQQQGAIITGSATDKEREQAELEDVIYPLGKAVAECCRDLGNEADAAKADFTSSAWRRMRDATLLANARQVIALASGLLGGAQAAVAAECGITAAAVAVATKEADDFEAVIASPQQAIAGRKGLTALLRDRFNAVEAIFGSLDNLIEQFGDSAFVAGYKAARITRDLGHGPATPPETPPSPPAPPAG